MRALFLRAATVALAVLALPGAADASWVSTGSVKYYGSSTATAPSDVADGIINYAVWMNDGSSAGDWTAQLGVSGAAAALGEYKPSNGGPGVATTATYTYLYQVVNTNPSGSASAEHVLHSLFIATGPQLVTSAGGINGYVFKDGASGNLTDYNNPTLGSTADPSLALASTSGGNPGAREILGIDWQELNTGEDQQLKFSYDSTYSTQNTSGTGGQIELRKKQSYTSVMFFTSEFGPVFGEGSLQNGSPYTTTSVPVPTPEPGTLALIGLGLPLMGWGYARRLRATKALATAAQ